MQDPASIRTWLLHDHTRLDKLFSQLLNAVEGADDPTISSVWSEFETGLLAHFDAEESHLFPLLAGDYPREVEAAQRQHSQIRALVAELGVRADLRTIRLDVAEELIRQLQKHAEFEDKTVYTWAEAALSAPQQTSMLERFKKPARTPLPGASKKR
jgi:hemerythrin